MRVHECVDEGLGHSSYLVDLGDGLAAVVDAPRFPNAHEQLTGADMGVGGSPTCCLASTKDSRGPRP